jgi:LytS/YehU family sensor histidine kinase
MVYGTVLGITLTSQSWTRERERERREAELAIVAREAELSAIRNQFQPHFVLNALNSLLALIDTDPALARTMVVRLADVTKAVFDRVDVQAVPLERELDLVKAYLEVERIRFGSRLSVTFDIDDAARGVMVPPFLLQPLVENAVKHGIAPLVRGGVITVTARTRPSGDTLALVLEVHDTGIGVGATELRAGRAKGIGLSNVERRLACQYAEAASLSIESVPGNGTTVRIVMPAESRTLREVVRARNVS